MRRIVGTRWLNLIWQELAKTNVQAKELHPERNKGEGGEGGRPQRSIRAGSEVL
jgi:hypothetical protein